MRGWLKLMVQECDAEFPPWEFLQAFSAFHLWDHPAATPHQKGQLLQRHLARIAQALKLPAPSLHWEFVSHQLEAKQHYMEKGCTFKEAWAYVCSKSAVARPKINLEEATLCWYATSCSTSGVEQDFSKGMWGFKDRQIEVARAT